MNISKKILLTAVIVFFTSCFFPRADLILKDGIFGYENNGKTWIMFVVENVGRGPARNSVAIISVIENGSEKDLDKFEWEMGDFLPGEMRDLDVPLPGQLNWGDNIRISIKFRWTNR